ncbi:MAG: PTS transporter subunit EIIA [Gemmatimonadetes bacterium]|nr:PTS sugar transporter subunit IIA [Gemmatimonadota bacterium]NIQ59816.1 PTS sugar transporter subunit IIA [Gemmatimonadota bacterium]NIU80019.1 PTS transporter subunit EIIA [Gammaproteobacteria bacterium]NIX48461.1 PTS transporter subunit EIIA [Gemmatimonadota bacterium]NIY12898.1 PTS transporter subunit EIIA [Gemmatimonadota bacterium]
MRLSEYLEPELVLLDLRTHGIEDTIAALVDHLAEAGRVDRPEAVRDALVQREASHTTSLGNGVALPHTTVSGLDRPLLVVAVAPEGVGFGPAADEAQPPDRLFFLLLSPIDQAGTHIKLLARIVRLVRSPTFVESLVQADSGTALVREVEREDALHV